MTDDEFKTWLEERNKAIAGSLEDFKAYSIKQGQIPIHPDVFEIMYHKCRSAVTSLSIETRQASNDWLIEHGYSSWL